MMTVGSNARRREGPEKIHGLARYVDDLELPGCLHGATLRSTIARGTIEEIRFDPDFPWDECVIADASDIPGRNVVTLIEDDQPLLADRVVRHAMEPILLVAHPERHRAYTALDRIHVTYREETPLLTIDDALERRAVIHGTDNVMKELRITKGDVEAALADAHVVVEGTYRVPHQEHVYIENNGMAAWFEEGRLVVQGSLQCPFYVHEALKTVFDLEDDGVRVIQAVTGGGFGGKEEFPNVLAGHAALLARKAGRPVKLIYDRHEDMLASTKRHPAVVRHRTGLDRNGTLVAQDIDVVMDAGAYVTLSPVVLSRGVLHATGPYACPNVRVIGRAIATNTPPNGAFRGFGAPQTLFAAELHWERIAEVIGVDALSLRRRNVIRSGSELPTGQVVRESVAASDVLERCVARSDYVKKRSAYTRWNRKRSSPTWKGIGLAIVHHGSGFTGGGEVMLASRAAVTLTRKGGIRVDVASTEIGQGTTSMLAQIVAETLGVPYERIDVATPDTSRVPNSGPTVASRTCMVVGGLLREAAERLKTAVNEEVGTFPATRRELAAAARRLLGDAPFRAFTVEYQKPPGISWDESTYRGDAYATYGYAGVVVDLEIDRATYEVTVRRVTAAHDVGRAIHPLHVEGQIIGGITQALGWALLEHVVRTNGVMANAELTNYIVPTAMDTPPMDVDIIERPYPHGPFGAKGVGEIPMDGPAPAAAAAIRHATGLIVPALPILPETLADALT